MANTRFPHPHSTERHVFFFLHQGCNPSELLFCWQVICFKRKHISLSSTCFLFWKICLSWRILIKTPITKPSTNITSDAWKLGCPNFDEHQDDGIQLRVWKDSGVHLFTVLLTWWQDAPSLISLSTKVAWLWFGTHQEVWVRWWTYCFHKNEHNK